MFIRSSGEDEIRWLDELIGFDDSEKVFTKASLISLRLVNGNPFVQIANGDVWCLRFSSAWILCHTTDGFVFFIICGVNLFQELRTLYLFDGVLGFCSHFSKINERVSRVGFDLNCRYASFQFFSVTLQGLFNNGVVVYFCLRWVSGPHCSAKLSKLLVTCTTLFFVSVTLTQRLFSEEAQSWWYFSQFVLRMFNFGMMFWFWPFSLAAVNIDRSRGVWSLPTRLEWYNICRIFAICGDVNTKSNVA